jgi:beta-phosphoglucomutase
MWAAVAFDFNGTLSNDEPVLVRVYEELFAELGRPMTEADYYEHLAGHTDEEMFTRWLGHSDTALIDDRIARYLVRAGDGSMVDEEIRVVVCFAAERVPVAVVSAALRSEIDPVLEAAGLREAVTVIVSQDDVVNGKPDPECYLVAAGLLNIEPGQMLVFEDTDVGLSAAKAAGAHVVGLTRTHGAARMSAADELTGSIDVPLLERLLCS